MGWLFDWDGADPATAAGAPAPDSGSGLLSNLLGLAAKSGDAAPKAEQAPVTKLDKEAASAALDYQPLVSGLIMLFLGSLVGDDLKPNEQQAKDITAPLLRILLRHVDVARALSPDARDALASAGAFALYAQAIYPFWAAKRAERKVISSGRSTATGTAGTTGQPTGNTTGSGASGRGSGTSDSGAQPTAASNAGQSAAAPAEGRGLYQQSAPVSAGDYGAGNGHASARANDVAAIFAEIGVGGL